MAEGVHRPDDGLAVGRQMLAEDNPGELWVLRGQKLPGSVVEQLDDHYPFILFPLRVETRFMAHGD